MKNASRKIVKPKGPRGTLSNKSRREKDSSWNPPKPEFIGKVKDTHGERG